jgi:hypothetical protein
MLDYLYRGATKSSWKLFSGPTVEGSTTMTNLIAQLPQQTAERVNDIIADVFNVATIALVGVLGVITVAATI